ncbi:MAG: dephospho-CoA kinase [Syntrophales bacterium]|nr:dephospho-CoA kinase [Syntrophales bacterium]MCK9527400.1 dephospho-CoA kinase [Syntrophales bacterium]MDX9921502.1 dephospho-CoA kinase [Syntrophales bacterium]
MFNVGLTGGIGTGKSTVALLFEKYGARMIDFDLLAHRVQESGTPVWHDIVAHFGTEILDEGGRIDRRKLGAVVFADTSRLERLNSIIHPVLFDEWLNLLRTIENEEPDAIVVSEIPLLIEGGWHSLFDVTVLVWASPERQIERVMARNALTRKEAEDRLAAQMNINDKIPLVDHVIDNDGDFDRTQREFERVWNVIVSLKEARND